MNPMKQEDIDYFKRGKQENPQFWERLGGEPILEGRTVLDVGCGHGSLCIDMALSGAKKVIGLDINKALIDFARKNLYANYPALTGKVHFECLDLAQYQHESFDLIVSKDSFEHIINLDRELVEMKKRATASLEQEARCSSRGLMK